MNSPYEAPKSPDEQPDLDRLETVFLAQSQVEALAIESYLLANEVSCVLVPLGFGNALAMGPLPETAFQIQVPVTLVEKAQELLETYAASEAVEDEIFEEQSIEEPNHDRDGFLSAAFRRRLKLAWLFLVIPLGPVSPVISLLNSKEALGLAQKLQRPTGGILLAMMLACTELGLYVFLWFRFK